MCRGRVRFRVRVSFVLIRSFYVACGSCTFYSNHDILVYPKHIESFFELCNRFCIQKIIWRYTISRCRHWDTNYIRAFSTVTVLTGYCNYRNLIEILRIWVTIGFWVLGLVRRVSAVPLPRKKWKICMWNCAFLCILSKNLMPRVRVRLTIFNIHS